MKSRRNQSASSTTQTAPATPVPQASVSASAISRLTEATIVLALLTFAGYWCTFCFEFGFFSYFDIPYYFVSVTPTLILSTSLLWVVLGGILGFVLLAIALTIILTPIQKDIDARYPTSTKIIGYLMAVAGITIFIYLLITDPKFREIWSLKTLGTGMVLVLVYSFFMWVYKNYKKDIPWSFVGISAGVTFYFVVLALVYQFLTYAGGEEAKKKDVFPVYRLPSSNSEVAIIRNYGEYLLAVPFTRITRKDDKDKTPAPFKKQLVIVKMPDVTTPLSLSFEQVGPLQPEGIKPVETKPVP